MSSEFSSEFSSGLGVGGKGEGISGKGIRYKI